MYNHRRRRWKWKNRFVSFQSTSNRVSILFYPAFPLPPVALQVFPTMVSREATVIWVIWEVYMLFLFVISFLTTFFHFRSVNRHRQRCNVWRAWQAIRRFSFLGLLGSVEQTLDQISSALAVVGLGLYLHPETVHLQRVGHTYAFSLALVQLLVSRRRGDGVVEGLRMVSIWMVHIFSPIRFNSATIPRLLQTVALLASLTELVERICWYASRPLPTSVRRPRRGIEYTYV